MCEESKANLKFLVFLLFGLLWACAAGALRAEEPGRWYLISETELRSIEQYRERSETEKRGWLLQARELKRDSENLNAQLAQARERERRLEQSFNKYETDQLTLVSLKNGEIADLKKEKADKTLEAEKYKGLAFSRLIIIIAGAVIITLFIAFKVCRFLRLI
jgi:hypothetical protein